jgi:hypothetical protein
LKASSSILGIKFSRMSDDYSIQGLVFASINQGLISSSIMKSYPNIYMHHCRCVLFIFFLTLNAVIFITFFI